MLVSQSASGWYGPRGDERVDESEPAADDFLAQVCVDWEAEAQKREELGMRVVTTRTGVVLSESGGALEKMLPPFKLGRGRAGGRRAPVRAVDPHRGRGGGADLLPRHRRGRPVR